MKEDFHVLAPTLKNLINELVEIINWFEFSYFFVKINGSPIVSCLLESSLNTLTYFLYCSSLYLSLSLWLYSLRAEGDLDHSLKRHFLRLIEVPSPLPSCQPTCFLLEARSRNKYLYLLVFLWDQWQLISKSSFLSALRKLLTLV